ncbi:MAG: hypothetical protein RL619_2393 [Bacteroidota bacterium]|jgi:hypothetical protein
MNLYSLNGLEFSTYKNAEIIQFVIIKKSKSDRNIQI